MVYTPEVLTVRPWNMIVGSNELGSLQLWRVHIQPATIHYLDPRSLNVQNSSASLSCMTRCVGTQQTTAWVVVTVVVSNVFDVYPCLGKWSNLKNIFQMGWNHQLDNFQTCCFLLFFWGGWFLSLMPLKYAKLLLVQCQLCQMILTHKLWIFMNHSWFLVHVEVWRLALHTNQKDRFQPHEPSNGVFF